MPFAAKTVAQAKELGDFVFQVLRQRWGKLKRRNVFRVGAAYLALGWIVTQVTTTVAPMLHLPRWVGPVVLWIGVIGFPFVVMFSWIYELTPEGLKREREVERTESITHLTARRLDMLTIGLIVVAIALFVLDRVLPHGWRTRSPSPIAVTPAAPASLEKSIAVLPFEDMSQAKDQEYFSDGISEELLNLLAKVQDLRVAARTSSFAFKGKLVRRVGISKCFSSFPVWRVSSAATRTDSRRMRTARAHVFQVADRRRDEVQRAHAGILSLPGAIMLHQPEEAACTNSSPENMRRP